MRWTPAVLAVAAALILASPALAGPLSLPVPIDTSRSLAEQFGYYPDYQRHVPTFDSANRPVIRSRTASQDATESVTTLRDGSWQQSSLTDAVRAAYPDFAGYMGAGGFASDRVVVDSSDRLYTIATIRLEEGDFRNVMVYSADGQTWRVVELPFGREQPYMDDANRGNVACEWSTGQDPIDGPPFIAVWREVGDWPGSHASRNQLYVTQPRWQGDEVVVPQPQLVTSDFLGMVQSVGGTSFARTIGDRTYFTWTQVRRPQAGVPAVDAGQFLTRVTRDFTVRRGRVATYRFQVSYGPPAGHTASGVTARVVLTVRDARGASRMRRSLGDVAVNTTKSYKRRCRLKPGYYTYEVRAVLPDGTVQQSIGRGRFIVRLRSGRLPTMKPSAAWLAVGEERDLAKGTPTYVGVYDHVASRVVQSKLVLYADPVDNNHCTPALVADSAGVLHLVAGAHHKPFRYTYSVKPLDISQWAPPEKILQSGYWTSTTDDDGAGKQTYASLVCGADDTLHLVFRQDCRERGGRFPGKSYQVLAYQSRPPGGPWSAARTLAYHAAGPGYTNYYQKLTADRNGRLFLSFSVYRHAGVPAIYRAYRRFRYRMLWWSDDGVQWHFATTETFAGSIVTGD